MSHRTIPISLLAHGTTNPPHSTPNITEKPPVPSNTMYQLFNNILEKIDESLDKWMSKTDDKMKTFLASTEEKHRKYTDNAIAVITDKLNENLQQTTRTLAHSLPSQLTSQPQMQNRPRTPVRSATKSTPCARP